MSFMMIGQQKGRNTKENILRNFAMPQPNGYRKALRFMQYVSRSANSAIGKVDIVGILDELTSTHQTLPHMQGGKF